MLKHLRFCLLLLSVVFVFSCEEDNNQQEDKSEKEKLISNLNNELYPLAEDPLKWEDDELNFLDPVAENSKIIGLGEATHGSSEFFNAKARIFKYLVKKHGYKVFAFEADFGESVIINRDIQKGNAYYMKKVMEDNMLFWTWKTEEVRDLLEWMCEYNKGKPENEKVHYMGIDAQVNKNNPDLINNYLQEANASFSSHADSILSVAKTASDNDFSSYNPESFAKYINKLEALKDSMENSKNKLVENSSEKKYELYKRILQVVKQTSKVRKFQDKYHLRDSCMAENSTWMLDYFDDEKVVVWAHNGHIIKGRRYEIDKMGKFINRELGDEYAAIGFSFSYGSFNAVEYVNGDYGNLKTHEISSEPRKGSINSIFSEAKTNTFSVAISDLEYYSSWNTKFFENTDILSIGAVYNSHPEDYYRVFNKKYFDHLIYFDEVSESEFIWNKKRGIAPRCNKKKRL